MVDTIPSSYTQRKAILYVRQSTTHQIVHHEESLRLQYQMKDRLLDLGFRNIEIIDEDLGCTASGLADRPGFTRMVAELSLGKIGAVAARELSRFSRNSRDWNQLMEICHIVGVLLIDQEGIYDLRVSNDRLLLGLKGNIGEYELSLMRHRLLEAQKAKAARGELFTHLTVGYCKGTDGGFVKNPDRRVQRIIELVFRKFLELGTAHAVVCFMVDHDMEVPVRPPGCSNVEHRFSPPRLSNICRILRNPWYCGTYAWGRHHKVTEFHNGQMRRSTRLRPDGECSVLLHDHHEKYILREDFERIQVMLTNNSHWTRGPNPGAPKTGGALLAGLLRCCRCGKRLHVGYGSRRAVRYCCSGGRVVGERSCISFVGSTLDETISREIMMVVEPAAQKAALEAMAAAKVLDADVVNTLTGDLDAAQYQAKLAQRQYDAVDPDNRQVASELELRWNRALVRVGSIERRLEHARENNRQKAPDLSELGELGADLRGVWESPDTDVRIRKRIARLLIEEIVIDLNPETLDIEAIVHWKGGVHTEYSVHRRRPGETRTQTPVGTLDAIRSLTRVCTDRSIAVFLGRNGLLTASGKGWTAGRVRAIRAIHEIEGHSEERQRSGGWMTLLQVSKRVGVAPKTIRRVIDKGILKGEQPLPQGPWILASKSLEDPKVASQWAVPLVRGCKRPFDAQQIPVFSTK